MQKSVVELINGLHALGHHVTVETNGTIYRETSADLLSLSVKLSSSAAHPDLGKRHEAQRLKYDQLVNFITYSRDYQFKFVINTEEDVVEILGIKDVLLRETNEDITSRIWVMPQGICSQQLDSKMLMLVAICKEHGWKLSDRMQLRIWGHMKGV